jgi:hypothetical protein
MAMCSDAHRSAEIILLLVTCVHGADLCTVAIFLGSFVQLGNTTRTTKILIKPKTETFEPVYSYAMRGEFVSKLSQGACVLFS